jgi:hypothetical protein
MLLVAELSRAFLFMGSWDVVPVRCRSLSEDGRSKHSEAIGRTMSTASKISCDAFAEKALRGMTALETDIDELARMASQGEVSKQAQDFCLRVAERLKEEMASMENDLLDLCSVMEEEFEVQCQNTVAAEVEAYEQCLVAVHVEVCKLFDRANFEVDTSLQSLQILQDVLEKTQTALLMSKLRAEQLAADKRVLQAERDALRIETRSNENAAAIKEQVMEALLHHKKTLAESQADKDAALKGQVEALQRQLHEAITDRNVARRHQEHAEDLVGQLRASGKEGPRSGGELADLAQENLPVLREMQSTLRTSEFERNRLNTELVTKYEENAKLYESLQRRNNDVLALEQEVATLRSSLAERKSAECSGASGGSTPPLSCHSQNPTDSPGLTILSPPRVDESRFLGEHLSPLQTSDRVHTSRLAQSLLEMCDDLKSARGVLDSLSAATLCDVCNANLQRRWRPKGKMQEYLAHKSAVLTSTAAVSRRYVLALFFVDCLCWVSLVHTGFSPCLLKIPC